MPETEHRQLGLAPREHFTVDWAKRDAFVAEYCRTGNKKDATAKAAVHTNTAAKWMNEKWFVERVAEVKRTMDRQMEGRITNILEETFAQIQTRLADGDPKLLRDGTVIKVPVAVRDLTVLAGVMFDKRAALRREDNPENGDVASSLDKIAAKLREYEATGKPSALQEVQTVDVEMAEVDDDNSDLI